MTTKIHRISNPAFALQIGQTAYSLSTGGRTGGDTTIFNAARNPNWEYAYQNIMGKRIVPYGPGNDLHVMVRNLVQDNNLAPGILQRQKGLLYGQGAFLYASDRMLALSTTSWTTITSALRTTLQNIPT